MTGKTWLKNSGCEEAVVLISVTTDMFLFCHGVLGRFDDGIPVPDVQSGSLAWATLPADPAVQAAGSPGGEHAGAVQAS